MDTRRANKTRFYPICKQSLRLLSSCMTGHGTWLVGLPTHSISYDTAVLRLYPFSSASIRGGTLGYITTGFKSAKNSCYSVLL